MTKPKKTKELTKYLNKIDKAVTDMWNYLNNDYQPTSSTITKQDIEEALDVIDQIYGKTGKVASLLEEVR